MKTRNFFKTLLLLVVLMAAGGFSQQAKAQSIVYEPYDFREVNADGDTLYYRITSDSEPYTVAVTRCHDSTYHQLPVPQFEWEIGQPGFAYPVYDYDSLINIPPTVTHDDVTYTVTDIDIEAFYYQKGIREVNLPATIEKIDTAAFYLSSLREITVQEGLKRINCGGLSSTQIQEIILPQSLLYLEEESFSGCRSLRHITIPDSITSIPRFCFSFCDTLNQVNFPEEIDTIEEGAFAGTAALCRVTIPSHVRYIGRVAFNHGGGADHPTGNMFFSIKCEIPPVLHLYAIFYDTITFEVPCCTLETYQNAWYPDYYVANSVTFIEDCNAVEEHTDEDIKVYPNPANDVIHIDMDAKKGYMVELFDERGKIVEKLQLNDNNSNINISRLASGFYFLKVYGVNNENHIFKISKQ